jgi:xanthine dehydrogenase accessory factor
VKPADELRAAGVAFVEATVVRCVAPTSARPGDRAVILGDGTIEGFVGGSCADMTVRLQALRALETGEPVLLKILPGDPDGTPTEEGAVVVSNPCLSGGALELFLEPHLPPERLAIAGETPVARALADLATPLGFAPRLGARAEAGDFAAVVASLGHDDEGALRSALQAGCEYVALVASRRRGAGVLDALRAEGMDVTRIHTPAGLDIGARTHAEIALSILAEIVAVRRARTSPLTVPDAALPAAREAVDPICGMTVIVGPGTPMAGDAAFCCEGCREAWLARAH